jgi:hypothetical protein
MGTDATGYRLYAVEGSLPVTISRRARLGSPPGPARWDHPGAGPGALEGVVAYAGPYRFHGDRVIHHVVLSLFPNWVGSDQQRRVELAGDRLS